MTDKKQDMGLVIPLPIKTIDPTVKPYTYTDFYKPCDLAFIHATWTNSFMCSKPARLCSGEKEYKRKHTQLIDAILSFPSTLVYVTRLKDDDTSILSYAVMDCTYYVLHYVYTKLTYRKCALAQNLVLGKGLTSYSMPMQNALPTGPKYLLPTWASHMQWNPYFLFEVMKHYGDKKAIQRYTNEHDSNGNS